MEESVSEDRSDSKAVLGEEGRNRLASLGYVGNTSIREDFEFDQSKDDPKDLIDLHRQNNGAYGLNNIAVAHEKQGKLTEAIKHYYEALRINPAYEDADNNLKRGLALRRR